MRILGVDMGSMSIKAVEIETAFRRIEVREYFEEKLQVEDSPYQALGRLIQQVPQKPDKILIRMPSSQVTFRNLMIPTRDRKAIDSAITFELEDELPFNLEECIYDYCTLSQTKQGTSAHIEVTLKRYIGELLDHLSDIQVDPDIVNSNIWSYRQLCSHIFNESELQHAIAIVDIGYEKSSIYVHHKGEPTLLREIEFGGIDLTRAISKKYNVDFEEAEKAKLDSGFVLSTPMKDQATADQIEFSEVLSEALAPLYLEVRKTNLATKSATEHLLGHIYLTGGGGLLPGLRQSLEDVFQIPTTMLNGVSRVNPQGGVTYSEETEAHFSLATGVALSGVTTDKTQSIDFRKDIFRKQSTSDGLNISMFKGPLMAGGAVSFCVLLSLIIQSQVYQSQIEDVDGKLKRGIRTIFPLLGNRAVKTYLASPDRLKKAIDGELKKQREISNLFGENSKSPVKFLKQLSVKIPKRINLDMTHFEVGAAPQKPDQLSLTFLLKSQADVELLESRLKDLVDNLQKQGPKQVALPDGSGNRFEVKFTGTPKEASYES